VESSCLSTFLTPPVYENGEHKSARSRLSTKHPLCIVDKVGWHPEPLPLSSSYPILEIAFRAWECTRSNRRRTETAERGAEHRLCHIHPKCCHGTSARNQHQDHGHRHHPDEGARRGPVIPTVMWVDAERVTGGKIAA